MLHNLIYFEIWRNVYILSWLVFFTDLISIASFNHLMNSKKCFSLLIKKKVLAMLNSHQTESPNRTPIKISGCPFIYPIGNTFSSNVFYMMLVTWNNFATDLHSSWDFRRINKTLWHFWHFYSAWFMNFCFVLSCLRIPSWKT